MNLLVTGGCGFIGSNFINYYWKYNPEVNIYNIDVLNYCADINNIKSKIRNDKRYTFIEGNIRCTDLIKHILKTYSITHIIHFAAQSHVDNSFEKSLQYTMDNIYGTHSILEASRQWGKLELFIHVSTDEVYGESKLESDDIKHEEVLLCPTNPYAATKAGAELLAKSYYHSFKFPVIITRGNNVFGENQYPEKLIPKFISLLEKGEKLPIQGDGSCVRNFLYIKDVVKAFTIILEKGVIGEVYNIGGEISNEYSVIEVAKLLIRLYLKKNNYIEWLSYVKDRPFNDKRYFITNEKLCTLGWKPIWNFKDALINMLEKMKKRQNKY